MRREFEMSNLGLLSYFLGMEFVETNQGVFMHQKKYACDVLKRFSMFDCNSTTTPAEPSLKLEKEGSDEDVDPTR